jgi:hypothetical protein
MEPMRIGNGAMEPMRFGLKWGDGTHGAMEPIETGQTPDEAALIERTDAG